MQRSRRPHASPNSPGRHQQTDCAGNRRGRVNQSSQTHANRYPADRIDTADRSVCERILTRYGVYRKDNFAQHSYLPVCESILTNLRAYQTLPYVVQRLRRTRHGRPRRRYCTYLWRSAACIPRIRNTSGTASSLFAFLHDRYHKYDSRNSNDAASRMGSDEHNHARYHLYGTADNADSHYPARHSAIPHRYRGRLPRIGIARTRLYIAWSSRHNATDRTLRASCSVWAGLVYQDTHGAANRQAVLRGASPDCSTRMARHTQRRES